MLEYKGYTAGPIDFNPDESTFSGTVAGLRDIVPFEGSTARELSRAFRASVDIYLDFCGKTGQKMLPKTDRRQANHGKKRASGAKAPHDSNAQMYGLKPVPSRKAASFRKPSRRIESAP